jgi:hypothetical protein
MTRDGHGVRVGNAGIGACYNGGVPTLLRWQGYRFYFFPGDAPEPPHVHVQKEDRHAKYWLIPAELARNRGFRPHEIREIEKAVKRHAAEFLEKWHETFRT